MDRRAVLERLAALPLASAARAVERMPCPHVKDHGATGVTGFLRNVAWSSTRAGCSPGRTRWQPTGPRNEAGARLVLDFRAPKGR
jgi:hypothetical protein